MAVLAPLVQIRISQTREGGVAGEGKRPDTTAIFGTLPASGEGLEVGVARPERRCPSVSPAAAAALGEPHHRALLALDDVEQAIGLHVVFMWPWVPARDGEVVGQGGRSGPARGPNRAR